MDQKQSRRRAWKDKLRTLGRRSKSIPTSSRKDIPTTPPSDRRSREWPLEDAKGTSSSTPLRKVFKVSPWTPSLSRLVPTNIKRPEGGKTRIQPEKRQMKSKSTYSTTTSSLSSEDESADIELKDLGAGVAMLHHEDEGHFEDMKLASSSSASRSPSYQSANTSINSRDIEIPRSRRGSNNGSVGSRSRDISIGSSSRWEPMRLADPGRVYLPSSADTFYPPTSTGQKGFSSLPRSASLRHRGRSNPSNTAAATIFRPRIHERQVYKLDTYKNELEIETISKIPTLNPASDEKQPWHQKKGLVASAETLVVNSNSDHQEQRPPLINREKHFKVLLIGDPNVGKTSFVQRYANDTFREDYKGTVGVDFALKVLRVSGETMVKLQLWDVAGQERFTWMTRVYYRDAKGCIIMLDLTNRQSFLNVTRWKEDLDSKVWLPDGSPIPCLLLANKCDLKDRQVDLEEIEKLYNEMNFIGWTETSAKDDMMVKDSVKFLVDTMIKNEKNMSNKSEPKPSNDESEGTISLTGRKSSETRENGHESKKRS